LATKDVIQRYFESLKAKRGWEAFLSDHMEFTSFTSPIKRARGRAVYIEATKRFFSIIADVEIEGMIVEEKNACVFTRYTLQPPGKTAFESHVAERFEVEGDRITSLAIYFDTAPYPK
jgi:ketosteroid isomerase-like protein